MGRIKGKNTAPEIRVRRLLHGMGHRFRLHCSNLPGKPDIVLPKYRLCIFVHGCFWHQHSGCRRASVPTSNVDFWKKKLARTIERDQENLLALDQAGWRATVIWECEVKDEPLLKRRLEICFRKCPGAQ